MINGTFATPLPEVTLRNAVPGDAQALASVHIACWREAYGNILPPAVLDRLSLEDRAAGWNRQIESLPETSHIILAECQGRLIGFGCSAAQRSKPLASRGYDGEITALYVLKSWQGRGAGGALLESLARGLIEIGMDRLALWVLADNRQARQFYERRGGGRLIDTQMIPAHGDAVELAYGWSSLADLLTATSPKSRGLPLTSPPHPTSIEGASA